MNNPDIEAYPFVKSECSQHKNPLIYFCNTHNIPICYQCENHKTCKKIDYEKEYQSMFEKFNFQKNLDESNSFFEKSLHLTEKLKAIIASLESETFEVKLENHNIFFQNENQFYAYEQFCIDKNIDKQGFIKAIYTKNILLFKQKYNEILTKMMNLEKEMKILESYYNKILKLISSHEISKNSKSLYESIQEVDISEKKIKNLNSTIFVLKNEPIDQFLIPERIRDIIKEEIYEIIKDHFEKNFG